MAENLKIVFSAQRGDFCLRFSKRSAFWKLGVLGLVCLGWGGFVCLDFCLCGGLYVKKTQTFSVGKQDTKKEKSWGNNGSWSGGESSGYSDIKHSELCGEMSGVRLSEESKSRVKSPERNLDLNCLWSCFCYLPSGRLGAPFPCDSRNKDATTTFMFQRKDRTLWCLWEGESLGSLLVSLRFWLHISEVDSVTFVPVTCSKLCFLHLCKHSLGVQTNRVLTFLLFTRVKTPTRASEVNFLPGCVVWYIMCSEFHQTYGMCNLAKQTLLLELERLCSLIPLCYLFNFH